MLRNDEIREKNVYKSPFMVSVNGFKYFMLTLAITLIGYFWMGHLSVKDTSYDTVRICTLIAVAIMSIEYVNFAKYSGSYVSNYALFLIAFIVFNFGLFLVFSFGGEYNFFYLKQYEVGTVLKTIQYEFGCAGALFLAGAWINRITPFRFNNINILSKRTIFKVAKMFMYITGIVAFALLAMKMMAFATGYYEGAGRFDASVPSILGLVEYFFVPFSVLTLIYSENRQIDKIAEMLVIIWSLATAMCGDRTSGIAGILIIMIVNFRYKGENKNSIKKYLISIATIILTAFLIVFIKAFREGSAFSASGLFSIFSDVLGELGSSFFPLTLIMRVCPQRHSFLYGVSYLYSILAGFIPASLDPTGTISMWNSKAIEPLNWISTEYDYTFGTGYSLCAEAYANFGCFGFLAIFIIGIMVIKLLAVANENSFSKYTATILMFEFFTLPRRNFYYVINHPFYCIVIVSIVILLFTRKFEWGVVNSLCKKYIFEQFNIVSFYTITAGVSVKNKYITTQEGVV